MGRIGVPELLLILVILIFLFGAKKLPEISRSIARAIKEFRRANREDENSPSSGGSAS